MFRYAFGINGFISIRTVSSSPLHKSHTMSLPKNMFFKIFVVVIQNTLYTILSVKGTNYTSIVGVLLKEGLLVGTPPAKNSFCMTNKDASIKLFIFVIYKIKIS